MLIFSASFQNMGTYTKSGHGPLLFSFLSRLFQKSQLACYQVALTGSYQFSLGYSLLLIMVPEKLHFWIQFSLGYSPLLIMVPEKLHFWIHEIIQFFANGI